ncbi:MAG: OmpA family protein [Deltaproteobacteria bacterium]|nr:OmpA family protein [Deltaproteobacteria bacterium]
MRKHHRPPDNLLPSDTTDTTSWTLGISAASPRIGLRDPLPPTRRSQFARTPSRGPLSVAAVAAVLVHTAAIVFPWRHAGPTFEVPSPLSEPPQSVAVEFTPTSNPPPPQETKTDTTTALQQFQTTALERAAAIEQSLTVARAKHAETVAAHQQHQQQQLAALETTRTQMSGALATLAEEKTALAAQLEEERQRSLTLARQVAAAEQAKAAELARVKGTYDRFVAALQGEISQKEIALHQAKERLTVTILDRVLFPSGQAALTPDGERIIAKVATLLGKISDRRIMIEGHTDNIPIRPPLSLRFPTNWELSTARATEVVKHILAQGILSAGQLSAVGRADTTPVASNAAEDGRRLNRRIEIIVLPPEDTPS